MLRFDREQEAAEDTPLLRFQGTNRELNYEESDLWLKHYLTKAKYPENTNGTHSLRVGGATAYAKTTFKGALGRV